MNETNLTATLPLSVVPDGFWPLLIASAVTLIVFIIFLTWVASPRGSCCCYCGCNCSRAMKRLAKGMNETLLTTSRDDDNDDETDNGAEKWWSHERAEANRKKQFELVDLSDVPNNKSK